MEAGLFGVKNRVLSVYNREQKRHRTQEAKQNKKVIV
jgi:hypothetical protein